MRPASPEYLERAAQFYLSRYASSVSNFKSVLQRKVRRRGLPEGAGEDEATAWIDAIAARFVAAGLLDDGVYGRARVASQRRKGRSRRAIEADLRRKGLSPALIEDLLVEAVGEGADPEKAAAVAFAQRRRLGPFSRTEPKEPARERQRALAAFARAGFRYALARRVLDLENIAAAEAMIREDHEG
ncbi:MAG: regulatory protein RecX [Alphaproteobacteria bacterium]